jgi:hypothetical protein
MSATSDKVGLLDTSGKSNQPSADASGRRGRLSATSQSRFRLHTCRWPLGGGGQQRALNAISRHWEAAVQTLAVRCFQRSDRCGPPPTSSMISVKVKC